MKLIKKQSAIIGLMLLLTGCTHQDSAHWGSLIGRTLGKPIGAAATAIDETLQTSRDIIKENPRYQRQNRQQQTEIVTPLDGKKDDYLRTEVLVKTREPTPIESINLQDAEDITGFWR